MKCPSCHFLSADQNDLCTKCLEDLRPYKYNLGLPIQNFEATANELREAIPLSQRSRGSLPQRLTKSQPIKK